MKKLILKGERDQFIEIVFFFHANPWKGDKASRQLCFEC